MPSTRGDRRRRKEQRLNACRDIQLNVPKDMMEAIVSIPYDNSKQRTVQIVPTDRLGEDDLSLCLDLFEANMKFMYAGTSWGFDLEQKRRELEHDLARFLLVWSDDDDDGNGHSCGKLVGFVHYRVEPEYDQGVGEDDCDLIMYLYELQVSSPYRKLGIGSRLCQVLEAIAKQLALVKIILTVFRTNEEARRFYFGKLKYCLDESSPESEEYEILSKRLDSHTDRSGAAELQWKKRKA